jgi:large subunit ribosomal protein L23
MEKNQNKSQVLLNSIKIPSLSEKSISLYEKRQYTFLVDRNLTKNQIKLTIQENFNVIVTNVNTCILPIKTKRVGKSIGKKTVYKKAFIKLKEGQTLTEIFN